MKKIFVLFVVKLVVLTRTKDGVFGSGVSYPVLFCTIEIYIVLTCISNVLTELNLINTITK